MKNLRGKILDFYKNEKSLRRKLTIAIVPVIILMGILSTVITYTMDMGIVPMLQAVSAFAVPVMIVYIGYRKKAYDAAYTAVCIFLSSILLPSACLTTGGLYTGMPVMCAASLLLCGLCSTPRSQGISFGLGIAANTAVFLICRFFPESVLPVDAGITDIHVYLCMMVSGIVLFAVGVVFIKIYDANSRMQEALLKHMDENVCRVLVDKNYNTNIRERCNIAVMFADICSFTSLSESMDTDTLSEFLNTYFSIVYKAVHDNGGIIDKYIGDCVLAFWKDEGAQGEAALKAAKAAMDIKRVLKEQCGDINDRFGCDLEFTAGINYGEADVGDIGPEDRKDYTIIGDTVNVASRIQEIAPKGEVYISEHVARIVTDKAYVTRVPKKVAIRGKSDPMDIYTLEGMEKPAVTTFVMDSQHPTGFVLHICGSRGSYALAGKRYSEFGGETSCYLFKKDKYALIVDCGSGLQRARPLIADCRDIDVIITHLHYDHVIGLIDFSIFPEEANLRFFGGFDKWLGKESLSRLFDAPYWPVNPFRGEMVSVRTDQDYWLRGNIAVRFYPASHPNDADLAVIYIGGRRVCIMADCENSDDLPFDVVDHCDILIYDGMYEDKYYHEHVGWGHSTWESGVRLALKANPGRLVISHHNPRNSDEKLRGLEIQAQKDFPATTFAKAGDRFVL